MNNPPAFPCHLDTPPEYDGMTLRDYFAAKAMQAMLQSDSCPYDPANEVPKASYLIADAMLKAREA